MPRERAAPAAWPQDCLLCLSRAAGALCDECDAALPRIETACIRCAVPLAHIGVCGSCAVRAPLFDDARACFEYRFPLDRVVQRFKFAGDLAAGRWLAGQLVRRLPGASADLVVVPPLSRGRLRERGFNQALELAKPVARALGVRCAATALVRVRETLPQPGLDRAERARNLRDAFRCDAHVDGLHVAIVDDVVTTGATVHELARVLKARGAVRVSVWAVARTPAPN